MMVWLCVAVRIVANPFSNVFQKQLTHKWAAPLFIICATHGVLSLAALPLGLIFPQPVSVEFWGNLSLCALLAVAGNSLIVQALKLSDLSLLGPINAYKPVVSLLPGMLLLHEFPGWLGAGGIMLVVAGSYLIVDRGTGAGEAGATFHSRFLRDRGIQCRFAALILSSIEAVFLKRALVASSPLATFVYWSILGFGVSLAAVAFVRHNGHARGDIRLLRENARTYLLLGLTTGLMQLCTIVTLEELQVGYALALFQTSALISVFLGRHFFDERHFLSRLAGAAVMVAGAALIIVGS